MRHSIPADLRRVEILLVAEGDDEALPLGKLRDQFAKPAAEERIACAVGLNQLRSLFERHRAEFRPPDLVDAAPCRDLTQPVNDVRRGVERSHAPEKLKEHVLGDLLAAGGVAQEVRREAGDGADVALEERAEGVPISGLDAQHEERVGIGRGAG